MAKMEPWHSTKPAFIVGNSKLSGGDVLGGDPHVYHDNDECEDGKKISSDRRAPGKADWPQCPKCKVLN